MIVLLIVYLTRTQTAPITDYTDFIIVAITVGVANFALLPLIYFKRAAGMIPFVIMLGDWAIAAAFIYISGGQPLIMIGSIGLISSLGLLRLHWILGLAQVAGVQIVALTVLALTESDYLNNFNSHIPELLTALLFPIATMVWAYLRDEQDNQSDKHLNRVKDDYEKKLNELRDSQRTLSDLATRLGSTLNYDKVLEAALDIGQVFNSTDGRVVGVVFLHRAGSETLYVASSRGLSQYDENRDIAGKEGIVGRTLIDCVTMIGGPASADPELREFNGLSAIQSMMCVPLRANFSNYGVLLFGSVRPNAFHSDRIETLTALSNQVILSLQNAVLYSNLLADKERIIEMEENARKALVRDLHDIPTQTISAVTMRVRIIQRLLERNQMGELKSELSTVEEMAQRATEEIRHVLFKLRPLALESQGLAAALDQLADKTKKTYKQNIAVHVQPVAERYLDQQQQGMLFYLIEEAVSNARKYAKASQINVSIMVQNDLLVTRIADNGVGFDTEKVNSNYDQRGSFGMVNMRERAEMINGTLNVESVPGKGTTITVYVPLNDESDPRRTSSKVRLNGQSVPNSKLALSASDRVTRRVRR